LLWRTRIRDRAAVSNGGVLSGGIESRIGGLSNWEQEASFWSEAAIDFVGDAAESDDGWECFKYSTLLDVALAEASGYSMEAPNG